MYLFLNNLRLGEIYWAIFDQKEIIGQILYKTTDRRVNLLVFLDKLLKKNKIKISEIEGLAVANGPGSFASIRTALAIVNTMANILKIKAVGVVLDENKDNSQLINLARKKLSSKGRKSNVVLPAYGSEPNISQPKKRI